MTGLGAAWVRVKNHRDLTLRMVICVESNNFLISTWNVVFSAWSGTCLSCICIYIVQGWEFAHLISERIARFLTKTEQMSDSLKKLSDSLIGSFLVSKMSDSLTLLISSEWPERITHCCSFPLSNLSDSLTFAHLSLAIWANRSQSLIWFDRNERISDEQMSEFPAQLNSKTNSSETPIDMLSSIFSDDFGNSDIVVMKSRILD